MALLNQFIDFDPIVDRLWGLLKPSIEAQLDKLREQVVALIPVIGAAAAKAIADKFPDLIRGILEQDPDIPIVSDVFDLSEILRANINHSNIPIHIPGLDVLGDIFKGLDGR
jgi:hypothetical protein